MAVFINSDANLFGGVNLQWIKCPGCGNDLFRISLVGLAQCSRCGRALEIPARERPWIPTPYPKEPPEHPEPYHPDVKGPTWVSTGGRAPKDKKAS